MNNTETIVLERASAWIRHRRPYDFDDDNGLWMYRKVDEDEQVFNVKTTAGIDFLFVQGYSITTGANGLNYIALSNDALTENTASTTLSNEISTNGLSRAQGTYAHTNGQSTATIDKTFTCATGAQAAQKSALFSAASTGTMNHVLAFTQRSLQVGDTLQVTYTITLS